MNLLSTFSSRLLLRRKKAAIVNVDVKRDHTRDRKFFICGCGNTQNIQEESESEFSEKKSETQAKLTNLLEKVDEIKELSGALSKYSKTLLEQSLETRRQAELTRVVSREAKEANIELHALQNAASVEAPSAPSWSSPTT